MEESEREGGERPGGRCWILVPCAGTGSRAGAEGPKQYAALAGYPLVAWTLEALLRLPRIEAVVVVVAPDDTGFADLVVPALAAGSGAPPEQPAHLRRAPVGGQTRAHTVANGLGVLRELGATDDDWVLVHDAARCLVRPGSVMKLVSACRDDDVGGLLALPVPDTLKWSDGHDRVQETVPRTWMWAAQTPQMFRLGLLGRALEQGLAPGRPPITDESSAVEALGLKPRLVLGDLDNFKVTWPEDFERAEQLLRARHAAHAAETSAPAGKGRRP